MSDHYDSLSQAQLISLLRKRDAGKKLGLVWERDEIEADAAIDANFIACAVDKSLSDGPQPWRNLVIEGDNFDALRWLRMTYAQRVKCIYIDPPYNTGNKDWVYNDHYIDANDRYRHSTWLEFLYRRLVLARDLLAKDGVVLVSINDENRAKLELLMDEALPGMRLGSFVWRTKDTGNDGGNRLSQVHEHVLIYGRKDFRFNGRPVDLSKFRNPDNDPRGDWSSQPLTKAADLIARSETYYPIQDPNTGLWYPCDPSRVWAYATEANIKLGQKLRAATMEQMIRDKVIYFPPCKSSEVMIFHSRDEIVRAVRDGKGPKLPKKKSQIFREDLPDLDFWIGKPIAVGRPSRKEFLSSRPIEERIAPVSSWISGLNEITDYNVPDDEITVLRTTRGGVGGDELISIFGKKPFNNPKPVSLIRELVFQSTSPDDLVLDFFAGSATTAQAVMEVNASDNGSRRFIMVSSTEATASEPDKNLCRDVTAERIRRLNAVDTGKYADFSADFAYLRTREIDFDALNAELEPAEAWTALEAMHGLPLTGYDTGRAWNEHGDGDVTLILADRTDDALISRLKDLASARANVFVYSWTPGQLKTALGPVDFEIRPVRETLVKRFQQ